MAEADDSACLNYTDDSRIINFVLDVHLVEQGTILEEEYL